MSEVIGTPKDFSCTLTTTASEQRIWQLWTDVVGWPQWDNPLQSASLEGNIGIGISGQLVTRSGQRSQFTVTEFAPTSSYAFCTLLPGATLTVRRFFGRQHDDGRLEFTHHVRFSGPLGGVFAALLGRGFMRQLPEVMTKLRQLAESSG